MVWRLWGIRHVRYWWHRRRLRHFTRVMRELGLGSGTPDLLDLSHLSRIWSGEA